MIKLLKSEKWLGKAVALVSTLALIFTFVAPNTLADFWRADYPNKWGGELEAPPFILYYGYGYGSSGWGWGYGYGYNYYPDSNERGYYVGDMGGENYNDPETVGTIGPGDATVVGGDPTDTPQITMTNTVAFSPGGGIEAVLPAGLQITEDGGGNFDATAIQASVGTVQSSELGGSTLNATVDFGQSGMKLNFNIPVQLTIPVPGVADGTVIGVIVRHHGEGFSSNSLSTNSGATCTAGVASPQGSSVTVSGGAVVIYTCSASQFAAYSSSSSGTPGGTTPTSSGGGGGYRDTISEPNTSPDTDEGPMEKVVSSVMGFGDVAGHWAEGYINRIKDLGIVSGKTADTFAPNDNITRAELTKVATKAFGISIAPTVSSSPFGDVSTSAWYAPYVVAARNAGIVKGYEGNVFSPNQNVNRAEALKILLEAAGLDSGESLADFPDVPADAWYASYVGYAQINNIVGGYANGTFGPGNSITRAEVAKIVTQILDMM